MTEDYRALVEALREHGYFPTDTAAADAIETLITERERCAELVEAIRTVLAEYYEVEETRRVKALLDEHEKGDNG